MKILVVDDMPSMRQVMMHMLISLGHVDPDEASCGLHALKMLRTHDYDLLITDLHMPNLDGEQLLSKIRHDKKLYKLPVLMVSCEDDKAKIMALIAGEVTGFMVKPFNLSTLKKQLDWITPNCHTVLEATL
ncbi:response regulator [Colwellia psychrerythraea]|uniref:Response regulator receiver protein n=1 Tax=Colwellia psychrerythraea TaxID=28229 RepID=A0A099KLY7_COLPS|nr:response regulator [Colwellia psychrerythraea]KGJ91784.1 response regulator receiver protein [Colwellia psychrerythraea]